jgi:hypothetical protein
MVGLLCFEAELASANEIALLKNLFLLVIRELLSEHHSKVKNSSLATAFDRSSLWGCFEACLYRDDSERSTFISNAA